MGQCVSQQPLYGTASRNEESLNNASLSEASSSHREPSNGGGDERMPSISEYCDPQPRIPRSRRPSLSSLLPKVKGSFHRKRPSRDDLSAAFNMAATEFKVAMLDVNSATEEELMTLSGISRPVARQIVEHRGAIGGFKKVEDLALVSGVGAARLQLIKPEVCVGKKLSCSSGSVGTESECVSTASSPKTGVAGAEHRTTRRRREPVIVNSATIFQLMSVDGITQELAAHIVHYRERKGWFKTLNDLRKVAGFNCRLISALGPYLTTDAADAGAHVRPGQARNGVVNGHVSSHRRTASLPSGPLVGAGSGCGANSLTAFGCQPTPVFPSLKQFSRAVDDVVAGVDSGVDLVDATDAAPCKPPTSGALRLLSWHLDGLSVDKARNPGVVDVVAKLMSAYSIDVAAVQGVAELAALRELCQSINDAGAPIAYDVTWCGVGGVDGCGYLHRVPLHLTSAGAVSVATLKQDDNQQATFAVVSYSMASAASETGADVVPQFVKNVMDLSASERIVAAVQFRQSHHSQYVEQFQELGYRPIVAKAESTSYLPPGHAHGHAHNTCRSNILVSRYAQKALTGEWGVIRDNLTHLLIPNGWSWNGPASVHCPIWLELTTVDAHQTDF